jgi:type I restriction-modification system DNA methylase subunit
MSISRHPAWSDFVRSFNKIAAHRHRYEVFRDFVTMAAISMHNAIRKDPALEAEYMQIVKRYDASQLSEICGLFAKMVLLLDTEPQDVLGQLYMALELGNTQAGQFFTPHEISELMARLTYGDELQNLTKPFITLSEPACGAGGMVLAFVKVMLSHGHDPSKRIWVQCQDVDRTAALMCYLQLSLWNVPAVVIVGNTLANEVREAFYTPAHYLGFWETRLRSHGRQETEEGDHANGVHDVKVRDDVPRLEKVSDLVTVARPALMTGVPSTGGLQQFDFGF